MFLLLKVFQKQEWIENATRSHFEDTDNYFHEDIENWKFYHSKLFPEEIIIVKLTCLLVFDVLSLWLEKTKIIIVSKYSIEETHDAVVFDASKE